MLLDLPRAELATAEMIKVQRDIGDVSSQTAVSSDVIPPASTGLRLLNRAG